MLHGKCRVVMRGSVSRMLVVAVAVAAVWLSSLVLTVSPAELPQPQCAYQQITDRSVDINAVPSPDVLYSDTDSPTIQECYQECCDYPRDECTAVLHRAEISGINGSATCYLLSCDPINSCSQTTSNTSINDADVILTFLEVVHTAPLNASGPAIPLADVQRFVDTFVLVFAGTLALSIGLIMLCLCLFLAYNFHRESQRITERKRLTDTKGQSFSYME